MLCSLAKLDNDTKLEEIKTLEKELGKTLLAFSCHDLKPGEVNNDELSKIKNLEDKLGVSLVAVA